MMFQADIYLFIEISLCLFAGAEDDFLHFGVIPFTIYHCPKENWQRQQLKKKEKKKEK